MNANKKTNGWILCPSQSFPGKFYYFNVNNGEAAWTLNEAENKDLKRDSGIQKVVDKSHCYPEPDSPPIDESPNMSSFCPNFKKPDFNSVGPKLMDNKVTNASKPVFGQAVFPTYMSNVNPYMPNIIWTPLQLPTSMYVTPEVQKQTLDQVTQTVELDAHVFVQSCAVPLSKRFINYEKPILNFNKDNKIENKCDLPKLYSSTPIKCTGQNLDHGGSSNFFRQINSNKVYNEIHRRPVIKEPVLKNVSHTENKTLECMNPSRSLSELFTKQLKNFRNSGIVNNKKTQQEFTDFSMNKYKKLEQKKLQHDNHFTRELNEVGRHADTTVGFSETQTIESKSCQKFYNIIKSTSLDQDFKNLHVKSVNPNLSVNVTHEDIDLDETGKTKQNNITDLDRNDLRLLLVARKRKLSETEIKTGYSEEKKLKPIFTKDTRPTTPKKRVTFNLDNQFEDHEEQNEIYASTSQPTNIQTGESAIFQTLRDLTKYPVRTDRWYIVPDTDVLLDDYEFIEGLVKTDEHCRLLIPYAVHSDIVALTSGDSRGRQRVYVARQIARRIALQPLHVMVQPAESEDITIMCTLDCILNCCLEAVHHKYHVVLITNDVELQAKAKALDIHCYKMQEIRSASSSFNPEVTFDLKKIKITVKNDAIVTESNLFLQNDFEPYPIGTSNQVPVNSVKQRLFEYVAKEKSDKLIDITRPKHSNNIMQPNKTCTLDYESDNTETSNEIGRDIQRLNFWDNKTVKVNRETRDLNQNITNRQEDWLNLNKVALNNGVIVKQKQMTNPSVNQGILIENAFENKSNVPNSKNLNMHPNNLVTSPFFQAGLEQTTFDRQELIRNNFHKTIPNSNNKYENVLNQPKTNANRGANQFKHLNESSMDIKLKRFYVKDRQTEERLVTRIDEWLCCFTQIMEDTLSNILQEQQVISQLPPPWTLHEAMQCVKKTYYDNKEVCIIIDTFTALTSEHRCDQGYIKFTMKPNDFMKIIGCGILLMQTLKAVIPNHGHLTEAEYSLMNIIKSLENPSLDPELPQSAPALSRFDKSLEGAPRQNFVKDPSDIIKYLKKHYIQWISYNVMTDDNNYLKKYKQYQSKCIENANIVRTFGKNLGLLKIDKSKIMTMGEQTVDETKAIRLLESCTPIPNKDDDKLDGPVMNTQKYPTTGPRVIRIIESLRSQEETKDLEKKTNSLDLAKYVSTYDQKQTKTEPKVIIKLDNIKEFNFKQTNDKSKSFVEDLNVSKHGNTFEQSVVTNGPKVVRNIKLIGAFERKLKSKQAELDLDILDYSDIGKDDISETITNQSASVDTANIISDLNISNITESNIEVDKPANDDIGFNNNNHSDDNNIDSTCNKTDSRDNNIESHRGDANYCISNDNVIPNRDAKLLKAKLTPSNKSRRIDHTHLGHDDLKCQNNDQLSIINNDKLIIDDQVNDSGVESESMYAYPLAKTFLIDLSSSLKMIHHFIETGVTDIRSNDFGDEKKQKLHNKAKKTHQCVNEIIYNLKSIIHREASGGTTLKDLLIQAGIPVTTDKRMSKYRQIVRKCLEQAQILQNALTRMLAMTDADFEANSITTESISSSIRFLNIFE